MSLFVVFEHKVSASEMFAGAYYYVKKSIAEVINKPKEKAKKELVVMVVGKM